MKLVWFLIAVAMASLASAAPQPAMAADRVAECRAAPYRQFDFWLGTWTVRNAKGKVLGQNVVTREQGGCVILERWSGASGVRGTSVNTFDATTGRWREIWVDSTGGAMLLRGGASASGMQMSGEIPDPRGGTVADRIEWTHLDGGIIRQHLSESVDGGRTWKDVFDGYSTRDSVAKTVARNILTQRLPDLNGDALTLHLVDVTYPPGGSSTPHSHPCPVTVYVTSGALRERIAGGATEVFTAGQSFYEPPNTAHSISANASTQEPARFIAAFLCDKQTELSIKEHR